MKTLFRIFCTVLSLGVTIGCQKELPEPENIDPIYVDLSGILKKKTSALEEELKKLEQTKKELGLAEPRSVEKKILSKDYSSSLQTIQDLRQNIAFYTIRRDRRKFTDRMTYKLALEAGKKWPDPSEYSDYQVNRRLNEASRQWSDRVPKLSARYPSSKSENPVAKAEAPAEHE